MVSCNLIFWAKKIAHTFDLDVEYYNIPRICVAIKQRKKNILGRMREREREEKGREREEDEKKRKIKRQLHMLLMYTHLFFKSLGVAECALFNGRKKENQGF